MSSPIPGATLPIYQQYPPQQSGAVFPGSAPQGGGPGAPQTGSPGNTPNGAAAGLPQDMFSNSAAGANTAPDMQALMQAMAQQQAGGAPNSPQAGPTQADPQNPQGQGSVFQHESGGFADKNISLSSGGGGFYSGWKGWAAIGTLAAVTIAAIWKRDAIAGWFGKGASAKAAELLKNFHGTEHGLKTELAKDKPETSVIEGFSSGISEFVEKTKKLVGEDSQKHEVLDGLHSNFEKLKEALGKSESITEHHKDLKQSLKSVYSDVIKPSEEFKTAVQEHLGETHKAATEAVDGLLEKLAGESAPTGKEALKDIEEKLKDHTAAAERMLEDHGLGKTFFNPEELLNKAAQGEAKDRKQALETLKHKLNLAQSNQFGLSQAQQTFQKAAQDKAEIQNAITTAKATLADEKYTEASIKAAKDKAATAEKAAEGLIKDHVDDDIKFAEELAGKTPEDIATKLPGELKQAAEQHQAAIKEADEKLKTQLGDDEKAQITEAKQAAEKQLKKLTERQNHVATLNKKPLIGKAPTIEEKVKEIKDKAAEQLKKMEAAETTKQAHTDLLQEKDNAKSILDSSQAELARAEKELENAKKAVDVEAKPEESAEA